MSPSSSFEMILALFSAVCVLHWIADRLTCPPSATLLAGGAAMAFLPGMPEVKLDPELVMTLFLPPLLCDGAWFTEIARLRRHLIGIVSLAVGAVLFSTLVVALVAHALVPALPWAACAALGAVVSPPDAISARAILARVRLPRRLNALLEGESLLNDATGLVVFRFAVAFAGGGVVTPASALGHFFTLVAGGIACGLIVGAAWAWLVRRLHDGLLVVIASTLVCWIAYVAAEAVEVSGVIAVVTTGLVLGWRQHVLLSAGTRVRTTSLWQVLVFLMEASVFVLIGFSLRDVLARTGGLMATANDMLVPIAAVIFALIVARFVWIYACDLVVRLAQRTGASREEPLGGRCAAVLGWAGMRGVVTLAAALTLPSGFPGRDFIVLTAFATILVTILVPGSTLGLLIRRLGVQRTVDDEPPMDLIAAERAMMQVQLATVERLAHNEKGELIHPQLLRRYTARVNAGDAFTGTPEELAQAIAAHFDVIIAAVRAGRGELVRLHRTRQIDDETLRELEHDLDLEEMGAHAAKA